MTANDSGHVNNLDHAQAEALKHYWINLTDAICKHYQIPIDDIVNSIHGEELIYLIGDDNPDTIILRWLRSSKWNVSQAVHQIMETLDWQHHMNLREIVEKGETNELVEELKTGKSYYIGYDKFGGPINYVPAKQHIKGQFPHTSSARLSVYLMAIGRKLAKPPVEAGTLIFDLTGFGMKNMDYQHLHFFQNLIQRYYPDAVAHMLVLNAPWIFYGCWSVIKSWVDPNLEHKIHFIKNEEELAHYIDPSILPGRQNNSSSNFQYIPPTAEDEKMLAALRADVSGRADVVAAHKQAFQQYLNVTLRWARNEQTPDLLAERQEAAKRLKDTFEKVVPYMSTRSHFHRNGMIDEPIFQATYERILAKEMKNN